MKLNSLASDCGGVFCKMYRHAYFDVVAAVFAIDPWGSNKVIEHCRRKQTNHPIVSLPIMH
ncbi:hypothetical protein PH7735_03967 [Shimia thalassica]|uniref:Uncharacterized protein n=1 Tax=Shimia thalassica TaxID=1715693 RepID=A0A0P1IQW8_9RHOB|nr:hypothetical protein PH7735_03967 [Shimia thalassica]